MTLSSRIVRPGRGRPKPRPERKCAAGSAAAGHQTRHPRKTNERGAPRFDRAVYRQRNRVERPINRITQQWAVATRYDTLGAVYQTRLTPASSSSAWSTIRRKEAIPISLGSTLTSYASRKVMVFLFV
jgi:hypothetical protein